jgi:hypothetical protein
MIEASWKKKILCLILKVAAKKIVIVAMIVLVAPLLTMMMDLMRERNVLREKRF